MSRYARQTTLPELGAAGQARLRAAHVLVVGAGGLAAPVLQYLVGAGVGRITLIDGDRVEETNLHRQTLFRMNDIGAPKARAAARHMGALNPGCAIVPVCAMLTPANAHALCAGADLVLDCADSFAASYTLSDTCLTQGRPLISASVVGMQGYAGGFCGGAPSLRAVFPDLPARLGRCDTDGVLGPSVGVVGAVQAQMALAVLARIAPSPLGQLVSYDAARLRMGGFRFDGAPEPEGCFRFIDAGDVTAADQVTDLRGADEPGPPLPGAARIAPQDFATAPPCPAPGSRAVLACRSGLRAWAAATHLRRCWEGEIALLALGDTPETDPPETDTPQGDTP